MVDEKLRILVVDDEEDARRLLSVALSRNYEVVEAENGLDALTKVELADPDLIIMDVTMPLMDGYQACAAIQRNPKYKNVPVLFLSGMDDKAHIKKGYEAGGALYLMKPIDPQRLLKNVEMHFAEHPPARRKKKMTFEELKKAEEHLGEVGTGDVTPEKKEAPLPQPKPQPSPRPQQPPRAPATRAPAHPHEAERFEERPRVMIIDDEEDMITMVRLALQKDMEVVWEKDSALAIEKIVKYEPDIILLDIMMPKFSGFQLLHFVRRNARFRKTPVIMVSAKSSQKDRQYALKSGADEYLVKPFSPTQLRQLVNSFVEKPEFEINPKKIRYSAIMQMEGSMNLTGTGEVEDQKFIKKVEAKELKEFIEHHMTDEEDKKKEE